MFWEFNRTPAPKPNETNNHVSPQIAVREGNWKLLVNQDGSCVELFQLKDDVYETTNVADKNPLITKKLKKQAIDWFNKSVNECVEK